MHRQRSRSRTRIRTYTGVEFDWIPKSQEIWCEVFNDEINPGGPCFHVKMGGESAVWKSPSFSQTYVSSNGLPDALGIPLYGDSTINIWGSIQEDISRQGVLSALNWDKLPSSTQFSVIQFFAEFDDTIGILASRWDKLISYGSIKWGLIPLIADVEALLKAFQKRGEDDAWFPYEDRQVVSGTIKVPGYAGIGADVSYTCTFNRSGHGDISFLPQASRLLDRIGFHPDFATLWDLVPFSFMVDRVISIGSFLKQFRQGGWVKTMYFTGWKSFNCKINGSYYNCGGYQFASGSFDATIYSRCSDSDVLHWTSHYKENSDRDPIEDILTVLDASYILETSRKGHKRH